MSDEAQVLELVYWRDGVVTTVPIGPDEIVVGRSPKADLVIDHYTVARTHAKISRRGAELSIEDMGGRNDTCVNHVPVTLAPLAAGDLITLGKFVLAVRVRGGAGRFVSPSESPAASGFVSLPSGYQIGPLVAVGFWLDEDPESARSMQVTSATNWRIRPQSVLKVLGPARVDAVVVCYLRSGVRYNDYLGKSFCRFGCQDIDMGNADLTDGKWLWPEGLVHYVEAHAVPLPVEFLSTIRERAGIVPNGVGTVSNVPIVSAFWNTWCDEIAVREANASPV